MVYVESESDKIFLTLLNKVKIYVLMVSCKSDTKLFKEAKIIKEYLKAKGIYIVFDSDNQTKEIKIQEIKTLDFTSIRIFLKLSSNHSKSFVAIKSYRGILAIIKS